MYTGGKFATTVSMTLVANYSIIPLVLLIPVSTEPVTTFSPLSTTMEANFDTCIKDNGGKVATGGNIIRLLIPYSELEGTNLSICNSTTQRCPNKIIKTFLTVHFFHLLPCQWHVWGTLSCKYLHKFFGKNFKRPWWYTQGQGLEENLFMKKTWSQKSRGTVPLTLVLRLFKMDITR